MSRLEPQLEPFAWDELEIKEVDLEDLYQEFLDKQEQKHHY